MEKYNYGTYLKTVRELAGYSQFEMSEMVDCSMQTISKIERGKQAPEAKLVAAFNRAFEPLGFTYNEPQLDELFEMDRAKTELIEVIKTGRVEEIEKKLDRFHDLFIKRKEMKSKKDDVYEKAYSKELDQHYVVAHLIITRKRGMTVEKFLDEAIAAFELRKKIPDFHNISKTPLTRIEYELLTQIGEAYMSSGDYSTAEIIFTGLLKNKLHKKSSLVKERFMRVSTLLAELNLHKEQYSSANKCLSYVFCGFRESCNTRMVYQCVFIQGRLFESLGDYEGVLLVDEFLVASQRLTQHLCKIYGVS